MIKFYLNEVPAQLRPPANGGNTGPLSQAPQQRKKVHEKQHRVLIVEDGCGESKGNT
jgi:hypothetical protein